MNTTLSGGLVGGFSQKLHKKKHCAGNITGTGSCLDADLIYKTAKILNTLCKKNKQMHPIDLNLPFNEIHEQICRNLHRAHGCNSEACMLTMNSILKKLGKDKKKFIESFQHMMPKEWLKNRGALLKKSRKKKKQTKKKQHQYTQEPIEPIEPVDESAMLSTIDIEEFLQRLRKKDPQFYDYGAPPIDFSNCSVSNLCRFNLKDHLSKKQTKIGIVFNTDPHYQNGEHWISLYMELEPHSIPDTPAIYYFDSYGRKPPKRIRDLIIKIQSQGEKCGKYFKYFYNDHPFQKIGTQCGMYAIDFINQMLSGKTFEEYLNGDVTDDQMKELRDDYFIDPNEL